MALLARYNVAEKYVSTPPPPASSLWADRLSQSVIIIHADGVFSFATLYTTGVLRVYASRLSCMSKKCMPMLHVHVSCPSVLAVCPYSIFMQPCCMYILHEHAVFMHANPCPCKSLLHFHVACPGCMFMLMSLLPVHASCQYCMSMHHVHAAHAACPWYKYMLDVHAASPSRTILYVHFECPNCMSIQHGHEACPRCLSLLLVLAACPCCASLVRVFAACATCLCCISHAAWTCSISHAAWTCWMSMLHDHSAQTCCINMSKNRKRNMNMDTVRKTYWNFNNKITD